MEGLSSFEDMPIIFPNLVLLVIEDRGRASKKDTVLDFQGEASPNTLKWGAVFLGEVKVRSKSSSFFSEGKNH